MLFAAIPTRIKIMSKAACVRCAVLYFCLAIAWAFSVVWRGWESAPWWYLALAVVNLVFSATHAVGAVLGGSDG